MKNLMVTATLFVLGGTAYGQGEFVFDAHDNSFGNNIRFAANCVALSGPDFFVQVFAGPDAQHLTPTGAPLPLNRTGLGAGYTDPFAAVFNVL